jgi:hypothetical protein
MDAPEKATIDDRFGFRFWILGESHKSDDSGSIGASRNHTRLFKTEIATPARSGRADNDMIDQLQLEDSARFHNSAAEAQISFRRGGISARMVMLC